MHDNKNFIPLSIPHIGGREKKYLNKCIEDNWVSTAGPYVQSFENSFAKFVGSKYAVACSSGTSALHLSLVSLGIGEGDIVLVSNLTFIATVNAIKYTGAEPILVDCDLNSWQMNVQYIKSFLEKECINKKDSCFYKKSGKKISAIIPAHILGHACDIIDLVKLTNEYNIPIVEDAAEALGVKVNEKHIGNFGVLGCFSFNGNKIITTGSGGMIVTNSLKLAKKVKFLSEQAKQPGNNYIHKEVGYNYRMSNIHAAIGLAQLENIEHHINKKILIAKTYIKELSKIKGISWINPIYSSKSSWWLFTILFNKKYIKSSLKKIQNELLNNRIESRLIWQPMNLSKPYKNSIYIGENNSKKIYNSSLSLPSSVSLKKKDQYRVIYALKNILGV